MVGYEGVTSMKSNKEKHEKRMQIIIMIGSVMLSTIVTIVSAIKLTAANTEGINQIISLDAINLGISLLL